MTNSREFTEIAGYELVKLLGSGGFANTYKAQKNGREWAVKIFHDLPSGINAQRFDREVETLQLEHPNLVRYEDSGIAPYAGTRRAYIVMPYLPGRTLRDAIEERGGTLPVPLLRRIGACVADGLDFLHKHNIAHRDLTPKNIYLTDDGQVLIIDFGLVRLQDRTSLTVNGQVPGTLAYAAPEQLRNEPDLHTDLYGLGATLYHALTGSPPFKARNVSALLQMIRDEDPEPPSVHVQSVPKELDDLVLALLAKEPLQRPVSAGAVAEDLRAPQPTAQARPEPYDRNSPPRLIVRASSRSAARAILGAAMTGEVPDMAVAAITTPLELAEVLRAAGFDPTLRMAIDTRIETTAGAVIPKRVSARGFAPENGVPYSHADLRPVENCKRVAREDIREQTDEGCTAYRSACFPFAGPDDPWIKRDGRLLSDQLLARDAANAAAPLYAMMRCTVEGLVRRDDRLSIANRFSRGSPDGFWVEIEGLSAFSHPRVIVAAFDLFFLLQERGVGVLAALPGPLVELAWSVGIAGAEIKLGRVGGWHGPSLRAPRSSDPRPRFEFPSIFGSFLPEYAVELLELGVLPESDCTCTACRLAGDPAARVAVADAHGLAAWLALRSTLSDLAVVERVERLRDRLDKAEEALVEVRAAMETKKRSPRHLRTLRETLELLAESGALEGIGKLRRVG